jgi:hypothetical protein
MAHELPVKASSISKANMKLPQSILDARRALLGPDRGGRRDARQWHPSALDFTDGVEVVEVVGTMPAELQDLFPPTSKPNGTV